VILAVRRPGAKIAVGIADRAHRLGRGVRYFRGACDATPYFGITSRASLLATTSRSSLRFFPASIIASREP
jgi:hypothetical protein